MRCRPLQVREMVAMQGQQVRAVPQAAAYVPGVVNLRNQVIPVIDMRTLLNLPSVDDESASIIEELHQREEDHINWLNELEACVDETAHIPAGDRSASVQVRQMV
jgi:chemotaxis signal transduction protein